MNFQFGQTGIQFLRSGPAPCGFGMPASDAKPQQQEPVTNNTPFHTVLLSRVGSSTPPTAAAVYPSTTANASNDQRLLLKEHLTTSVNSVEDFYAQNSLGESPLHIACRLADPEAVSLIIERFRATAILSVGDGADDVNNSSRSLALLSDAFSKLFNLREVKLSRTPLHVACSAEHFSPAIIRVLVDADQTHIVRPRLSDYFYFTRGPQLRQLEQSSSLFALDKNEETPLQLFVRELSTYPRAGNWSYRPPPTMLSPRVGKIGVKPTEEQQALLFELVEEPFKLLVNAVLVAGTAASPVLTSALLEPSGTLKQDAEGSSTCGLSLHISVGGEMEAGDGVTLFDPSHPINQPSGYNHLPILVMLALEKELLPLMKFLVESAYTTTKATTTDNNDENNSSDGVERNGKIIVLVALDPTARSTKKMTLHFSSLPEGTTAMHTIAVKSKCVEMLRLLVNYIDTFGFRVCELCGEPHLHVLTATVDLAAEHPLCLACPPRAREDCTLPQKGQGSLVHPMLARDVDGNTVLHCCTGVTTDTHGGSPFPSVELAEVLFFHPKSDLSVNNFLRSRAPKELPPWTKMKSKVEENPAATSEPEEERKKKRYAIASLDELDGKSVISCLVERASRDVVELIHRLLSSTGALKLTPLPAIKRKMELRSSKRARECSYMCSSSSREKRTVRDEEERFRKDQEEMARIADSPVVVGQQEGVENPVTAPKTLAKLGFYDPSSCGMSPQQFYGQLGSPLHAAIESNSLEILELFLDCGIGDINMPRRIDGMTVLHLATLLICRGSRTITDAFILGNYGCDFWVKDANGRTALDLAVLVNSQRRERRKERDMDSDEDDDAEVALLVTWLKQQMGDKSDTATP